MKKQKHKHGYYAEQKEAKKAAKTGISIEKVYEEYLKQHEALPKEWRRKHYKIDANVKAKQAQQVAFALHHEVKYEHIKITEKQLKKEVRELVIREHKVEGPHKWAGYRQKIDLTIEGLKELKPVLGDTAYKRFYRRLVEASPERKKLEFDAWVKEIYQLLENNFTPEQRKNQISRIFYGSVYQ